MDLVERSASVPNEGGQQDENEYCGTTDETGFKRKNTHTEPRRDLDEHESVTEQLHEETAQDHSAVRAVSLLSWPDALIYR